MEARTAKSISQLKQVHPHKQRAHQRVTDMRPRWRAWRSGYPTSKNRRRKASGALSATSHTAPHTHRSSHLTLRPRSRDFKNARANKTSLQPRERRLSLKISSKRLSLRRSCCCRCRGACDLPFATLDLWHLLATCVWGHLLVTCVWGRLLVTCGGLCVAYGGMQPSLSLPFSRFVPNTLAPQEKAQMDALVEELQQQLTRLPLQQRARFFQYSFWVIIYFLCGRLTTLCLASPLFLFVLPSVQPLFLPSAACRFAKAASKASSSDKVYLAAYAGMQLRA